MVISGNYNYSDPKIQDEVETLTQKLENTSYISNSLYTESWLRTFVNYVERNNDYLNVTIDNEEDFIQNLKEVKSCRLTNIGINRKVLSKTFLNNKNNRSTLITVHTINLSIRHSRN